MFTSELQESKSAYIMGQFRSGAGTAVPSHLGISQVGED